MNMCALLDVESVVRIGTRFSTGVFTREQSVRISEKRAAFCLEKIDL